MVRKDLAERLLKLNEEAGVTPVSPSDIPGLARWVDGEINRVEDVLIEQHNAPFHADCIHVDACSTLPIDSERTYRVWFVIPGYNVNVASFDNRDDAEMAAMGAVFCGAGVSTIEWVDGRVWRQETWGEVQS